MSETYEERSARELGEIESEEALARERHPEIDDLFEVVERLNGDIPCLGELVTDAEDAAIWAAVDALRDAVEAVAGRLGRRAAAG